MCWEKAVSPRLRRIFLALVPEGLGENHELKHLLGKFKRTLAEQDRDVKWTLRENWHVTLLFLGDLVEEQARRAQEILTSWRPPRRGLELELQGVGAFPQTAEARVLWLGVARQQELLDLQSLLESVYLREGFEVDEREYHPHLTLARFRNPLNATELVKLGGRKFFGRYWVKEVVLYESVLQGHYPKYLPLVRQSFDGLHKE